MLKVPLPTGKTSRNTAKSRNKNKEGGGGVSMEQSARAPAPGAKGSKKPKPGSRNDDRGREQQEQSSAAVSGKKIKNKGKTRKERNLATTPKPDTTTPKDGGVKKKDLVEEDPPTVPATPVLPAVVPSREALTPPMCHQMSKEPVSSKAKNKTVDAPAPSTKTMHTRDADKWPAEATARAWLDKADFAKTKQEFEKLQKMEVDVEKECKKWKANSKKNQEPKDDFPVLDSNLVKSDEYVNMSHVEVPLRRNLVIGQMPVAGGEESFWRAVFELRATNIHLLIGDDDTLSFFPQRHGDFMHYGSMFVNNRRVESVSEDVLRFAIEVLPAGFSNSIISNLTVVKNWGVESVHAKHSCVIKETIELSNFLASSPPDENALIVSKHGAGRAGYFVSLSVAVTKMDQKSEPHISDIVKAIRAQRPKAVDSLTQYASLYIAMFYYIKRKTSKTTDGDKKAVADPHDPLCKKSVQLTTLFTNELIAEAAAAAARSSMTQMG